MSIAVDTADATEAVRRARASYRTENLTKLFPGTLAVDRVSLQVDEGEIHGVIGKNGAGKTVLMSLLAGLYPATSGSIRVGDDVVDTRHHTPARARAVGVALIPQEPVLANDLSVLDNLFMGRLPRHTGLIDFRAARRDIGRVCERLGITVDAGQPVNSLPIEDQQMLALGRALFVDQARVILLDEITASLSQDRKKMLSRVLREVLAERPDISVTLITHHIDEVLEFCDRVTVMRDGRAVKTILVPATTKAELAAWIVGTEDRLAAGATPAPAPPPVAAPRKAGAPAADGTTILEATLIASGRLENLSFRLHRGEVLGIAGLEGSGKDEVFSILAGITPPSSGAVAVEGRTVRLRTPAVARRLGIAYLPKKRDQYAIISGRPVDENTLAMVYPRITRWGVIRGGRARGLVEEAVRTLRIKTPSIHARIDSLSGGNRQKTMVARVITADPLVYLLNEPTRGVDLATIPELLAEIRGRLTTRAGVIVSSESQEELVEVCDRVLVLYRGRVVGDYTKGSPDFNPVRLFELVQGVGL